MLRRPLFVALRNRNSYRSRPIQPRKDWFVAHVRSKAKLNDRKTALASSAASLFRIEPITGDTNCERVRGCHEKNMVRETRDGKKSE